MVSFPGYLGAIKWEIHLMEPQFYLKELIHLLRFPENVFHQA